VANDDVYKGSQSVLFVRSDVYGPLQTLVDRYIECMVLNINPCVQLVSNHEMHLFAVKLLHI